MYMKETQIAVTKVLKVFSFFHYSLEMLVKVLNSVEWSQVYLVWRNYYEQKGHTIAFQTFFHPNNFFAPDSDTVGIPLKLGLKL